MEPDPAKNIERDRRRISSILKTPWKSTRFSDTEQQENVVECVKPVEKRNSKRVSFAAANDVLLFSKDVRSSSPARNPCQEIMTTAAAANRGTIEDGNQQIVGMESLLSAPLHDFQHRDKVHFDRGENLGEKTVMFSTHEAFMDMTHSQTINIANESDLPGDVSLQNCNVFPKSTANEGMFFVDTHSIEKTPSHNANTVGSSLFSGRNVDLSVERKSTSASMPCVDPMFESFLASLSMPTSSHMIVNPADTRGTRSSTDDATSSLAPIKTQRDYLDKENQAPTFASNMMRKSVLTCRKTELPAPLRPEEPVNTDTAGAQAGLAATDDANPFHWLFPSQDMYASADKGLSERMNTKGKPSSTTDQKDTISIPNPPFLTGHQRHAVCINERGSRMEKTVVFSTDEANMDITQSHTVNLACGSLAAEQLSGNDSNQGFKNILKREPWSRNIESLTAPCSKESSFTYGFLSHIKASQPSVSEENVKHNSSRTLKKMLDKTDIFFDNDTSMDVREAPIGRVVSGTEDHAQHLYTKQRQQLQKGNLMKADVMRQKSGEAPWTFKHEGRETSLKLSSESKAHGFAEDRLPLDKCEADVDCTEKTVRFTAGDDCMDVTQSNTVNIIGGFQLPSHSNVKFEKEYGEESVALSADKSAIDKIQSHPLNISRDFKIPFFQNSSCREKTTSLGERKSLRVTQKPQNFDLQTIGDKTVRFSTDDAAMDVTKSLTVNIAADFSVPLQQNTGEKTVRFTADEAAIDVTQCHTVNIATEIQHQTQNLELLSAHGEKTVRFTMDDANMDVTKCCTVNIASALNNQLKPQVDSPPTCGEKTVRFTVDDAGMDVTKSLTVNIARHFQPTPGNGDFLLHQGKKTSCFPNDDAAIDVTQRHTVNVAPEGTLQSRKNIKLVPIHGQITERFSAGEDAMDVTSCHTAHIASDIKIPLIRNSEVLHTEGEKEETLIIGDAQKVPSLQQKSQKLDLGEKTSNANENVIDVKKRHAVNVNTCEQLNSRTSAPQITNTDATVNFSGNDAGMDVTQCLTANVSCYFAPDQASQNQGSALRNTDMNISCVSEAIESEKSGRCKDGASPVHGLDREPSQQGNLQTDGHQEINIVIKRPDIGVQNKVPDKASLGVDETVTNTKNVCQVTNVSTAMTEVQTEREKEKEILQCFSSMQIVQHQQLKETSLVSQQSFGAIVASSLDIQLSNQTDSDPVETGTPRPPIHSVTAQKVNSPPNIVDQETCSLKSRRRSLADLQSKVRRLSHIINAAAPEVFPTESSHSHQEIDSHSNDGLISPVKLTATETENTEDDVEQQCPSHAVEAPALTTPPFGLKTKRLLSSLSVGGFKPKLPRRSKPEDLKKFNLEPTGTVNVDFFKQPRNFDLDVSNLFDEELASCDDISETLDTQSPQKTTKKEYPPLDFLFDNVDDVFEDSTIPRQKRLFPDEDDVMRCVKRTKESAAEMTSQCDSMESDSNTTVGTRTTRTTDSSNNSHTASIPCETTFESTYKQSLFESQLEDYASDVQKKLEDGTITVLEFFKLCNIDFVIHNPRQSIRPGTASLGSEATSMDLLRDQHIGRPKQMVYQTDVHDLTEKVEKLKFRMGDLNKLLKAVNKPLWEEIRYFSEKELKAFCAKIKEKNNFFRKTSKVQSHEMKEVLYSNLLQANLEEQQKLKGTIGKADEMIKTLDDCILELEKELAAVVEKGFDNKPSLTSLQEEIQNTSEASADNERQICELELQKKQNLGQVKRVEAENSSMERHLDTLNKLIEWNLKERREDGAVYTFLHQTMYLQLKYEKSTDKDVSSSAECKMTKIDFHLILDDEKSQSHARLVHTLVSQYIQGKPDWVKEYPTRAHVPTLLRDVSLVVSHCRLLGEECRQLKMWGSLPFDILSIQCRDSQVHVVFSSLRKFSKFEVVFGVTLVKHLYVLRVDAFNNRIGNITIHQVEEIVASLTLQRNFLTKTIKRIHQTLLC